MSHPPKRHWALSVLVIFIVLVNAITASSYFTAVENFDATQSSMSAEMLYIMALVATVNVVFAAGIWQWRRWGVYGFYVTSFASAVVSVGFGLGWAWTVVGLAMAIALFLLTRKQWSNFS